MIDQPVTVEELAGTLGRAAAQRKTIELGGHFTKRLGAGPIHKADITVSTASLTRILAYEPRDLTISVEAGITYGELSRTLAANRQMIPLDPAVCDQATIGGIVASNSSGPRRRLYGTARDLVIGMRFATLEGKLVQSGGMVVKNVAGLDMGKLMIGSWGTLAALASVNFKLLPMPSLDRTMLLAVESPAAACKIRDQIIRGVLQPSAIDFLNLQAAGELGYAHALLAVELGGNESVVTRSRAELSKLGEAIEPAESDARRFWNRVQNFTPQYLEKFGNGAVVRVSSTLTGMRELLESLHGPAIARAGSGVVYAYFNRTNTAVQWMAANSKWTSVVEYAPAADRETFSLWPSPGSDIEIMKRIKSMFDPQNLLKRGRYYRLF